MPPITSSSKKDNQAFDSKGKAPCINQVGSNLTAISAALRRILCCAVIIMLLPSCATDQKSPLKIGANAPDFSANDLTGATFSLSSLKGHPVVIRFFLTDCKFCKADTPVFNRYYEKNKANGLQMVYINNTALNRDEIESFATGLNISFPVIFDKKQEIAKRYRIKIQPQTIILAPDHHIIGAILGGVSEAELDDMVKKYL